MSSGHVMFHNPDLDDLARRLCGGNPTRARVGKLLQELEQRRKESFVDTPAPPPNATVAPPPTASTASAPAPSTERALEMLDKVGDLPDDAQAELVRGMVGEFSKFDVERRAKILSKPMGLLRKASRIDTLTEAANILLHELDEQQRDRVLEIARENGWPAWVVVLGSVARSADLQELAAGEFKPDWLNQGERSEKTPVGDVKCHKCGGVMPGARRGQTACCNRHGSGQDEHSDGCALAYLKFFEGSWVDSRRA